MPQPVSSPPTPSSPASAEPLRAPQVGGAFAQALAEAGGAEVENAAAAADSFSQQGAARADGTIAAPEKAARRAKTSAAEDLAARDLAVQDSAAAVIALPGVSFGQILIPSPTEPVIAGIEPGADGATTPALPASTLAQPGVAQPVGAAPFAVSSVQPVPTPSAAPAVAPGAGEGAVDLEATKTEAAKVGETLTPTPSASTPSATAPSGPIPSAQAAAGVVALSGRVEADPDPVPASDAETAAGKADSSDAAQARHAAVGAEAETAPAVPPQAPVLSAPKPLADPRAPADPAATVAAPAVVDASDSATTQDASTGGGSDDRPAAGGQGHAAKPAEPASPAPQGALPSSAQSIATPSQPADAAALQTAPSTATASTATSTAPQAAAAVAAAVVSGAVAAASAGLRRTRFEVQLDGDDLGRIDVRLDIGRGGRVGARLTVDSAEARDLLQADAKVLQRTLEQAGFRLPEGGFTVEVRDGGSGNGAEPDRRPTPADPFATAGAADHDDSSGRDAAPIAYRPLRSAASALDVRV